ncbi:MAG TPA: hypothetical protein VGK54_01855 [Chloroflexota bacterium]
MAVRDKVVIVTGSASEFPRLVSPGRCTIGPPSTPLGARVFKHL